MDGYSIAPDGKSITCQRCGLTSHNLHDVEHRYCGHCHVFHDDCSREFDCVECGRHIVAFVGPISDLCGACQTMPGWFNDPEIARVLDPDNTRRPRTLQ
jgi:hypothetical protein